MKPEILDCRGMVCPVPIIQVRLKLNLLRKDDQLVILSDDATFHAEFARFCQLADIILLSERDFTEYREYHIQLTT